MKRFYSTQLSKNSTELTLTGDEFHHLKNVMRLKAGESIEIINGLGLIATALIDKVERSSAKVTITEGPKVDISKESPIKITLLQGLLKGGSDEAVKSATVLGVSEIRFFISEFTAAKPDKDRDRQQEKWRKHSIEAAKQCARTRLPKIDGPIALSEAVEKLEDAFKIALYEDELEEGLKDCLKKYKSGQSVAVIIGPEGGLSTDDLNIIRSAGFHTVRMGPRRLRSEAATHTVLSIIDFELGGLGGLGGTDDL